VFYGITGLPQLIHGFSYGTQMVDVSFGLYPDGDTQSLAFLQPTPATTNVVPEPLVGIGLLAAGLVRLHRRRGQNPPTRRPPALHDESSTAATCCAKLTSNRCASG